jgi:hypothetical protein
VIQFSIALNPAVWGAIDDEGVELLEMVDWFGLDLEDD